MNKPRRSPPDSPRSPLPHRARLNVIALLLGSTLALCLAPSAGQAQAPAQAPAPDSTLVQARKHLEAQQPKAAYELLEPLEPRRAGDPQFDYLLGISALDAGHITRAIFALERVLALQPDNNLARAEIARAYIVAGEADTGRAELESARRGPMPADAAAAIDRVLSALSQPAADARTVRGYIDLSAGRDSNINSATAVNAFAVPAFGGALFTLAPGSRAQDSTFAAMGAGVSLRQPIGEGRAFIGSVTGRFSFNESTSSFNPGQLDASAGLSQTQGADTFSGAVQVGRNWLDGRGFRSAYGLSGQWQHNLGGTLQVAGFGQWSRLSYPGQNVRDADRYVVGAGLVRALEGGDRLLFVTAYAAREDPRAGAVPHLGHDATGMRLGGEMRTGGLTWFAQLQGEWRRYGGAEPFFSDTRHDRQLDLGLGVHYVPAPLWRVTPQISHARNRSNIVLYDYKRTVVQLTARRDF